MLIFLSGMMMPVSACAWNVIYTRLKNDIPNISEIHTISAGDTIRMGVSDGKSCDDGFTADAVNVTLKGWGGSSVRQLFMKSPHHLPAVSITADNLAIPGIKISGNTHADTGAGGRAVCIIGSEVLDLTITGPFCIRKGVAHHVC